MRSGPIRAVVWLLALVSCVAGLRLSLELTYVHLKSEGYVVQKAPGLLGTLGWAQISAPGNGVQTVEAERDKTEVDEGGWLDSLCSATASASCEEVAKSRYATWRLNIGSNRFEIPVSLLGMFYFTGVLVWLVLIGSCSPSRWWAHLILVAGTAVGVGISALFEYYMWTELEHYCPLCVIVHVLSLLLLVFALLLWPRQAAEVRSRAARPATVATAWFAPAEARWPQVRILLATPLVALLVIWAEYMWLTPVEVAGSTVAPSGPAASRPADDSATIAALTTRPADALAREIVDLRTKLNEAQKAENYYKRNLNQYEKHWLHAVTAWRLSPPVSISLENKPVRGPANAPHTMVIFSDFQCPACKKFEDFVNQKLLPLSKRGGGLVRIVFKQWPICTDCNPHATHNLHPAACRAALASEAARIVGGDEAFWKMYDLLWETQPRWKGWKENQDFNVLAREIGLDEQAFARAMASDEAMAQVKADIEEGANLGKGDPKIRPDDVDFIKVSSTPSIFVDGKRLWRAHASEAMWTTIFTMPAWPSTQPVPGMRPAQ